MLWRLRWSTSGDGGGPRTSCWRIEPSTNRDAGRFDARSRGELQRLVPGEQRRYQLEIGALLGREAIDAFGEQAAALAGRIPASTGGRT